MPEAPPNGAPHNRTGQQRAMVVGTGLIGGSIGMALRRRGWWVAGTDLVPDRSERALRIGALDVVGADPGAAVTFIATPAGAVAAEALRALGAGHGVVTDVAGVKCPIVAAVEAAAGTSAAGKGAGGGGVGNRFVGGHPMAGSEQEGVEGADPDLFEGATWVLTPTEATDARAYSTVQAVVSSLGAQVVAVTPSDHDDLVAMVSHVPHLTAATLMNLAAETAVEHATLLRLAAGGFRDMTRIAAGHPGIWPDVCAENRAGILAVLDRLVEGLASVRTRVAAGDRAGLLEILERARQARVNLPAGVPVDSDNAEIRIPVPDRPGVLAEVTTLLGGLGVNIYDLEIAHSAEGDRGVLVLLVAAGATDQVGAALHDRGYRVSVRRLAT